MEFHDDTRKLINHAEILSKVGEGIDARKRAAVLAAWGLVAAENTVPCPKCGRSMTLGNDSSRVDGLRWTCDKYIQRPKKKSKKCHTAVEFRFGTFFARSNLPIWKLLGFAHFWADMAPLRLIKRECRIEGSKTLVDWASFCREVVVDAFINHGERIGGPGKIVEIDESKFGKRKYHKGHHVEGVWVFGGYERGSGRVFLLPVEDRTKETLLAAIKDWILPGTVIYSDMWKAYDCLKDEGYVHLTVNHSLHFKDPETNVHTNGIESCWRSSKASISAAGRVKHHLAGNLACYMFIRRCRDVKLDPTMEFFRLAGLLYNTIDALANAKNVDDDEPHAKKSVKSDDDMECSEEVDEYGNLL